MYLYCLICSAPDVPSNPSFISIFLILKLLQTDSFFVVVVVIVKSNCHKNVSSFSSDLAFLLWSNWARGQSCRRISPGSVTSFYTQTHCDFKVCYHISLQSWKWELLFLEMRNSHFPTGVPIPSLIFWKDIGKQMFKAIMSFLWQKWAS